jgi:hypothetical protein
VFEVLSESTLNDDLVLKNAEYRATPSIQRDGILPAWPGPARRPHLRQGHDAHHARNRHRYPLAEIYGGIDLVDPPPPSNQKVGSGGSSPQRVQGRALASLTTQNNIDTHQ